MNQTDITENYFNRFQDNETVPAKKFYRLQGVDVSQMQDMAKQMKKTLFALADGEFPNDNYTLDDLKTYCESLVAGQHLDFRKIRVRPGCWPLTEDLRGMPGDARVDFIFFPTYIAVSILARTLLDYPDIALRIKGYAQAMVKGQFFCTLRGLNGHGYEATTEMLAALEILCKGRVPYVLDHFPDYSHPKLQELLGRIEKRMITSLATGNTWGNYGNGTDYRSGYETAVQALAELRKG